MTKQTHCFDLLGVALALLGSAAMSIAADPPAPAIGAPAPLKAATEAHSPAARREALAEASSQCSVAVRRGDTLDRLIVRHLTHLPLRQDLLRQALIKKNPTAFKGGKAEGLLAGSTLQLPMLTDFRYLFTPVSDALPAAPEQTPAAVDPRKSWIRFP